MDFPQNSFFGAKDECLLGNCRQVDRNQNLDCIPVVLLFGFRPHLGGRDMPPCWPFFLPLNERWCASIWIKRKCCSTAWPLIWYCDVYIPDTIYIKRVQNKIMFHSNKSNFYLTNAWFIFFSQYLYNQSPSHSQILNAYSHTSSMNFMVVDSFISWVIEWLDKKNVLLGKCIFFQDIIREQRINRFSAFL